MRRGPQQNVEEAKTLRAACKVLIFDEGIEDLTRYAEPFEAHGCEVQKCMSVETAMRSIEREEFDFALLDQGSSAFEGLRVIRHLVRYNLRTPFVVTRPRGNPPALRTEQGRPSLFSQSSPESACRPHFVAARSQDDGFLKDRCVRFLGYPTEIQSEVRIQRTDVFFGRMRKTLEKKVRRPAADHDDTEPSPQGIHQLQQ